MVKLSRARPGREVAREPLTVGGDVAVVDEVGRRRPHCPHGEPVDEDLVGDLGQVEQDVAGERLLRAARGVPSADVQAPELLCSLGHLDDQRRVRGRLIIADVQRDSDQVRVVDNVRFTGR